MFALKALIKHRRRSTAAAIAVLLILGAAIAVGSGGSGHDLRESVVTHRGSDHDYPEKAVGLSGVRAPLDTAELVRRADAVIVGTPVSQHLSRFRDAPGIPPEKRHGEFYERGSYIDVEVEVLERIKGETDDSISVRRLAPGQGFGIEADGQQPAPVMGTEQVLLLFRPGDIWGSGYLLFHGGVGLPDDSDWQFGEGLSSATTAELREWATQTPRRHMSGGGPTVSTVPYVEPAPTS